jgi:hypothetical protein
VVWSVEEQPSLQAIERASGYVETDSGQVVRALKSTYERHGTLSLLAALEVGTGQVHSQFTASKKREEFGSFLEDVLADQPPDREIHVIVDHYSPPKRNDDWLAKFHRRVRISRRLRPVAESDGNRVPSAPTKDAPRRKLEEPRSIPRGYRSLPPEAQ